MRQLPLNLQYCETMNNADSAEVYLQTQLSDTAKLDTIVTRIAVVAMQFIVPNSHIGAHQSVAQLNVANAAFEAVHVVKQAQALDYHRSTASYNFPSKYLF